jgi:hypothetical protein
MAPRVTLPSDLHGDKPSVAVLLSQANIAFRNAAPKSDSKKHHCGFKGCNSSFKSNVDNARHEWTHFNGENERFLPFPCRVEGCSKKFAQASQRDTHENTVGHGGAAIHVCICGFAANDNSSLRRHIRPYGENHPEHRRVQPVGGSFQQPSPVVQETMEHPAQGQEDLAAALPASDPVPTHIWVNGLITPPLEPLLPADVVAEFKMDQYLQYPSINVGQPFDAVALYHEALEQQLIAADAQMVATYANNMAQADTMWMPGDPPLEQALESTPGEYSGMVQDHDLGYNAQYPFQQQDITMQGV